MKGVTAIQPAWLGNLGKPLTSMSKVMEDPEPRYDAIKDEMKCFARLGYGNSWSLPAQEVPFPESLEKYRWFSRFFLEGLVIHKIKSVSAFFSAQPSLITRNWSVGKVNNIVQALASASIDSRAKLEAKWATEPKFLLRECSEWMQSNKAHLLDEMWPPKDDPEEQKKLAERVCLFLPSFHFARSFIHSLFHSLVFVSINSKNSCNSCPQSPRDPLICCPRNPVRASILTRSARRMSLPPIPISNTSAIDVDRFQSQFCPSQQNPPSLLFHLKSSSRFSSCFVCRNNRKMESGMRNDWCAKEGGKQRPKYKRKKERRRERRKTSQLMEESGWLKVR